MKYKLTFIVLLLYSLLTVAQEKHLIKGKVVSDNFGIKDVLVVNVSGQSETRTDSLGNFSIRAKLGDLLALSSYKIIDKKIRYTKDLSKNNTVIINVEQAPTELDEVVVNKYNISTESLGIMPKGQKKYTAAERKLYTAGDFKPIHLLALLGGSLQIDPIINAINGKTKRLKKEINVESREALIEKTYQLYIDDEITGKYKIPANYIKGFIFYIAEDNAFAQAVNNDEKEMADLIITGLSIKYLELIKNEN